MKVYLAGPINTCGMAVARAWREEVREKLEAMGIEVLDPMRPGGHISEKEITSQQYQDPAAVIARDLRDVAAADLILVNFLDIRKNGDIPCGTMMEIYQGCLGGSIVVTVANDFKSIWLNHYSHHMVENMEEAMKIVEHWKGIFDQEFELPSVQTPTT